MSWCQVKSSRLLLATAAKRLDQFTNRVAVGCRVSHSFPHLGGSFEPFLQILEFAYLLLVLLDPPFDNISHKWTRCFIVRCMIKNVLDLAKRESKILCGGNEAQPLLIGSMVDLVAVPQVSGRLQQSDARVVSNGK